MQIGYQIKFNRSIRCLFLFELWWVDSVVLIMLVYKRHCQQIIGKTHSLGTDLFQQTFNIPEVIMFSIA